MAKGYKDKMVVRWSVDNTSVWPFLQQTGINIDMIELDDHTLVCVAKVYYIEFNVVDDLYINF